MRLFRSTRKEASPQDERLSFMWNGRFHPRSKPEGYWPTPEEYELIETSVLSSERAFRLESVLGQEGGAEALRKFPPIRTYIWLADNLMEEQYLDALNNPVSDEILDRAIRDYDESVVIPSVQSEKIDLTD